MQWFRLYHDIIDSKVFRLSGELIKIYLGFLCLASISEERGKILMSDADISWRLRVDEGDLSARIEILCDKKLIHRITGGYEVHDWKKYQYASDSSTARVRKHRQKKERSGNVPETSSKRSSNALDTESDTDTEPDGDSNTEDDFVICDEVVTAWNEMSKANNLPVVRAVSGKRKVLLEKRLKDKKFTLNYQVILKKIGGSDFLAGRVKNAKWKGASFDWLLGEDVNHELNYIKVLEDRYSNKKRHKNIMSLQDIDHEAGPSLPGELPQTSITQQFTTKKVRSA